MNFHDAQNLDDMIKYAKITKDMVDFYHKRTNRHIDLVRKYCKKIHEVFGDQFGDIIARGLAHDQSKWEDPEFKPYIYITWDYRCKDMGEDPGISAEIREEMHDATEHHVDHNRHHPEYHCKDRGRLNREDRDAPTGIMIDAAKMEDLDIAEMIADWCAMGEEKRNSPVEWADKNVNKRWKFKESQKNLIYRIIDAIWE